VIEEVKEILVEALEECEKSREHRDPYSRLGHLKGAVMVALNYFAVEVKEENRLAKRVRKMLEKAPETIICQNCGREVAEDEYSAEADKCIYCLEECPF